MVTISAIPFTLDSCFCILKEHAKLVKDQNKIYGAPVMKQNLLCSCSLFLSLLLLLVLYVVAQIPAVCKEWAAKLNQDWIFRGNARAFTELLDQVLPSLWSEGIMVAWKGVPLKLPYLHNPVCWNAWSSHPHTGNGSSQGNWNSVGCNLHSSPHIHLYL